MGEGRFRLRIQFFCLIFMRRGLDLQRFTQFGGSAGEVLVTDTVARTATAKAYTGGKRLYGYVEGDLLYAYDMAAMGEPLQPHLWARLQRQ